VVFFLALSGAIRLTPGTDTMLGYVEQFEFPEGLQYERVGTSKSSDSLVCFMCDKPAASLKVKVNSAVDCGRVEAAFILWSDESSLDGIDSPSAICAFSALAFRGDRSLGSSVTVWKSALGNVFITVVVKAR
jgi:hypothetical protein